MKTLYTVLCCFCVGIILAQSDIASIEYFIDTDPGIGLATTIDIVPDAETIDQNFSISTTGLSVGTHRLFIRVINSDGESSMYEHKTFRVAPPVEINTNDIVEAEYFFNQDPGIGLATTIDLIDANTIDEALTVSTTGLPIGTHRLFVRVKNSSNEWSLYEHKTFRVAPPVETNTNDIVEAEYFFNQDPGIGLATTIDLVDANTIDEALTVSTTGLPIGTHRLFVRVKNSNNNWSLYEHKTFRVASPVEINTANIVAAEYFIDVDPGFGSATMLTVFGETLNENLVIPTAGSIAQGDHYLHIRVQNANGTWSLYERTLFEIDGTLGITTEILSEVSIYPNPASGFIHIKTPHSIDIKSIILIDMNGKIVINSSNQLEQINISHLTQGVYLLQIQTNEGRLSKRIIKN